MLISLNFTSQTCFGIPYPSTTTPQLGMEYSGMVFPPSTLKGVLAAMRKQNVDLVATQFAMNLITCMRVSPPPLVPPTSAEGQGSTVGEDGERGSRCLITQSTFDRHCRRTLPMAQAGCPRVESWYPRLASTPSTRGISCASGLWQRTTRTRLTEKPSLLYGRLRGRSKRNLQSRRCGMSILRDVHRLSSASLMDH